MKRLVQAIKHAWAWPYEVLAMDALEPVSTRSPLGSQRLPRHVSGSFSGAKTTPTTAHVDNLYTSPSFSLRQVCQRHRHTSNIFTGLNLDAEHGSHGHTIIVFIDLSSDTDH
jgi:hypothetical protein